MTLTHRRIHNSSGSTIAILTLDGRFICWILEDGPNPKKVFGETRIPAGRYLLKFRDQNSAMHTLYAKKYPQTHRGMIEITGIPGYGDVYYHIGNTPKDTLGCPLTGTAPKFDGARWSVTESTKAYEVFYPIVSALMLAGPVWVEVTDE